MTSINLFLTNMRYFLYYHLQSTNKISDYAKITIFDRLIYVSIIISLLLGGVREYKLLIIADLVSRTLSLVYAIIICKDIVLKNIFMFYFSFKETYKNIQVGIKLMISNTANMLIIGIVRFGIERTWGVGTFGKVSLVLSISNALMLFINTVGIVLFPILRRTKIENLSKLYLITRNILIVLMFGFLVLFYPLKVGLSIWLPKYQESLRYMILVFPMIVFEAKTILLVNTYLKTLRKERLMLIVNLLSVIVSLISTLFLTLIFKSLDFAILSILILLIFRNIVAEKILSKKLSLSVNLNIFLELILTLVFIFIFWFNDTWFAFLFYLITYFLFLMIKRKELKNSIVNIKPLLSKNKQ